MFVCIYCEYFFYNICLLLQSNWVFDVNMRYPQITHFLPLTETYLIWDSLTLWWVKAYRKLVSSSNVPVLTTEVVEVVDSLFAESTS